MMSRVIVWISAGAASAIAGKISLQLYKNVCLAYCDTRSEHSDNERFISDLEDWYGQKIERLTTPKFHDIWDVFEKTRWLVGPKGARCTTELKKNLRENFQLPDDKHIFGYTFDEKERAESFIKHNPDINLLTPLIDQQITHDECIGMIGEAGIEIPVMYKLGYGHNNCIGCVKGQQGYWNKIRVDFPIVFARMAKVENDIGASINKSYKSYDDLLAYIVDKPVEHYLHQWWSDNIDMILDKKASNKTIRMPLRLDDLDPDAGNYDEEPQLSCDMLCQIKYEDIK